MVLNHRVGLKLVGRAAQAGFGKIELLGFEVRPAEAVEKRTVFRLELQRLFHKGHRLVETLAALGEHVPEVVERGGILWIVREQLPEGRLGLREFLLFVERRAQFETDGRVRRKLCLRFLQKLHRLRAAIGLGVHLRQRHVSGRFVGVLLHRLFEQGNALLGLAREAKGAGLEAQQAQIVGMIRGGGPGHVDSRSVFLRGDVGLDEIAGHRRVLRRQTTGLFKRGDGFVVLPELLIREAKMRQQQSDVEGGARRLRDHRRQRVNHRLILAALFQGFGQRVVAPGASCVLRDHFARAGLRARGVAEAPLRLRQQIQRALTQRVRGARACHLGEHVARLGQILPPAGVEKRRRVAGFHIRADARAPQHALVDRHRVGPAALALVEVAERRQQTRVVRRMLFKPRDGVAVPAGPGKRFGQHGGTVLPAGFLGHEIGEDRDRFLVLARRDVHARQCGAHVGIALRDRPLERRLEMSNRLGEIIGRRLVRGGGARAVATSPFGQRGVDNAEHAVRFAIRRRKLQRLLGRSDRFLHFALSQIESRELCRNVRRQRVQFHRALVRRDRAVLVFAFFEMMGEKELRVRFGRFRHRRTRLRCRGERKRHAAHRDEHCDPHTRELFHKRGKVSYIPLHAGRSRAARDSRLPQL